MILKDKNKKIIYHEFEVLDYTPDELARLKKVAIEEFSKDERAQIEYAVVFLLQKYIETELCKNITKSSKKEKGKKTNGSKNNNRQ